MSYTLGLPVQYAPTPNKDAAIGNGSLYIGVANGNPASNPADRIQVYVARQGLSDLAISQPIDISPGGVPMYNGSPATLKVNSSYSVAILNYLGSQIYYSPKDGEEIDSLNTINSQITSILTSLTKRVITVDAVATLRTTSPSYGGQVFYVLGHTTAKLGGGLFYYDQTDTTTADDNGIVIVNGTYRFKRILNGYISPEMFGCVSTSTAIETTRAFNKAFVVAAATGVPVHCDQLTYTIDGNVDPNEFVYGGIQVQNNTVFNLNGATITMVTSPSANYAILNCYQKTDFVINGPGTLIGDVVAHTGTGEFGHGVWLAESKRATVNYVTSKNCWGDGFYISEETHVNANKAADITLNYCIADSNRRQGCSVTGAINVEMNFCKFINTGAIKSTAPSAGIDIEPQSAGVPAENIRINNCYIANNSIGIVCDTTQTNNISDVVVNNTVIKNSVQSGYFCNRDVSGFKNIVFNSCRIDQGVYGGVATTFNDCVITRDGGSTSTYVVETTSLTKKLYFNGGEIRSIGSAIKLIYIPGGKAFKDRVIFNRVDIVLESGPSGTSLITFSPVEFVRCNFLAEGTIPGSTFGFDFADNRLGKNYAYLNSCYIDSTWNGGISYVVGQYNMNEAKIYNVTQTGTVTPNCGIGDNIIITMTSSTGMGIGAPTNAYGKMLTVTLKNTSGGALGSIVWNAIYKLSAWTNPANGFSRSISFMFDGTNWVEVSRSPSDVPN